MEVEAKGKIAKLQAIEDNRSIISIARGTIVDSREEADIIFDINDAQSIDKIMVEFMG